MTSQVRVDEEKIRLRIRSRDHAAEVLACREAILSTPEFWQEILEIAAGHGANRGVPEVVIAGPQPMGDEEARKFENSKMPFGYHAGTRIFDVPISYLLNLSEGEFTRQLARYARSEAFFRRQATEE